MVKISKRYYRSQGSCLFSSHAPIIYTEIQTHWKSPYLDVVILKKLELTGELALGMLKQYKVSLTHTRISLCCHLLA